MMFGDAFVFGKQRQVRLEQFGDGERLEYYKHHGIHWLRLHQHPQLKNIRCLEYTNYSISQCQPQKA